MGGPAAMAAADHIAADDGGGRPPAFRGTPQADAGRGFFARLRYNPSSWRPP
jgi:hypothetical protein